MLFQSIFVVSTNKWAWDFWMNCCFWHFIDVLQMKMSSSLVSIRTQKPSPCLKSFSLFFFFWLDWNELSIKKNDQLFRLPLKSSHEFLKVGIFQEPTSNEGSNAFYYRIRMCCLKSPEITVFENHLDPHGLRKTSKTKEGLINFNTG